MKLADALSELARAGDGFRVMSSSRHQVLLAACESGRVVLLRLHSAEALTLADKLIEASRDVHDGTTQAAN